MCYVICDSMYESPLCCYILVTFFIVLMQKCQYSLFAFVRVAQKKF